MSRLQLIVAGGLTALTVWILAGVHPFAQAPLPGGVARTDIEGDWSSVVNEDAPHRGPGPELGDYTGLPINAADRQKAESWDASVLSQPERQTQAHPVQYWIRGPQPSIRILRILDPVTQQLVAYAIAGGWGRADRLVWMDGRQHPSDYSEHTWDGYSTGVWEDGQLAVTTTHMKMGVVQRNGAATSPYGVMTEHWFRHGLYMTMFWSVDDPVYFEEPMVRSHTWAVNLAGFVDPISNAFESVDELAGKPLGWVPFFPLGTKHTEFAEAHNLPFKATQGGKENLYPEYVEKIRQFGAEERAVKAPQGAR
jgi:hypothetical protein